MNMMEQKVEALIRKRGGKPLSVLIIDDEPGVRDVFREFCLSSAHFQVTTATGGAEAIDLVARQEFDIVTMDLVMPEMSGLEAIETIKRQKPHLPVVIVTGNATDALVREAGRLGGCRVLRKPVGLDQFLHELTDLAEEKYG